MAKKMPTPKEKKCEITAATITTLTGLIHKATTRRGFAVIRSAFRDEFRAHRKRTLKIGGK